MALSETQVAHFRAHGYVVQEQLFSDEECAALCAHLSQVIASVARDYVEGRRTEFDFWKIMVRSKYAVEVFWNPSGGGPAGRPVPEWERFAMRIGHGLHLEDPVFAAFCRAPRIVGAMRQLVEPPLKIIQSAVIYKQPRDGMVQFGPHQDAGYLTTEPESLVLAYVALDSTDRANGCLEVVPGSHRTGLAVRYEMTATGWKTHGRSDPELHREPTTPLPLGRGSVAFVHGRTYHASQLNRTDRPRRGLIVHAMSAGSRFSDGCWIQEPPGGFAIV